MAYEPRIAEDLKYHAGKDNERTAEQKAYGKMKMDLDKQHRLITVREHAGKSAHAEEAHPLRVKHSDMHKVAEELRHEHGAVHSHDPIYQHPKKNK
jgi:pyruvoyl-dependent arginine decarboxylase (PvlArgDC)